MKRILAYSVLLISLLTSHLVFSSQEGITGKFFNVTVIGRTLSIIEMIKDYPAVGIRVLSPLHGLAGVGSECQLNPGNGFCIFPMAAGIPKTITLTGNAGIVVVELCLNGNGPVTCQLYPVTLSSPGPSVAYVTTGYLGNVFFCSLNENSTFNACSITPSSGAPGWVPVSSSLATVNGTRYAYVADDSNGNAYQCSLNLNGSINACSVTPSSGAPAGWLPAAITFATVNGIQYAYVADENFRVFQCSVNANGSLGACAMTPAVGTPFWVPVSISFATVNGVQYAYVADYLGSINRCSLNVDGSFNTCQATPTVGAPLWLPQGVLFTTVNGIQYAYVSDFNGNIYQCGLNVDGTFNACSITPSVGAPAWAPLSTAFATFNDIQYGYVSDFNGNVFRCGLNANGSFSTCSATPPGNLFGSQVWSVSFNN